MAPYKGPSLNDVTEILHIFDPLPLATVQITQPISTVATLRTTPSLCVISFMDGTQELMAITSATLTYGRTPGAPWSPHSHAALAVVLEQGGLGRDPERRHRLQRRRRRSNAANAAADAALERGGRRRRGGGRGRRPVRVLQCGKADGIPFRGQLVIWIAEQHTVWF